MRHNTNGLKRVMQDGKHGKGAGNQDKNRASGSRGACVLAHQEETCRKELWKDTKQLGKDGDPTQMYEKSPDHTGEAD